MSSFTHTFLLPLEFGVCDHALHALLHAPPLCQLPLQLLLPALQLLLKGAFVLLVHPCGFLKDIDLRKEFQMREKKTSSNQTKKYPLICTDYLVVDLDLVLERLGFLFQPLELRPLVENDFVFLV